MGLLKYINGVLFIDDNKEDVAKLYQYFEKTSTPCMYINPLEYNGEINTSIGFARFVFLDLEYLNGEVNIKNVVSLLRSLAENGLKNVILILWTLHDNKIDELIELINDKMQEQKPLIILDSKKSDFLELKQTEFEEKLDNLLKNSIDNNPIIFKMLEWEKNVNVATYKTLNELLGMSYNHTTKEFDIEKILSNMASQSIPEDNLSTALNLLNEILTDEINRQTETIENITLTNQIDNEILYKLNYHLMFNSSGLQKTYPGNIYISDNISNNIGSKIEEKLSDLPDELIQPILIDITPPCTFARSTDILLLSGVIIELPEKNCVKKVKEVLKKDYFLKELYLDNDGKTKCIVIDYLSITSQKKEEVEDMPIICIKESYRKSLQQQFAGYLGRVGNNIYHN